MKLMAIKTSARTENHSPHPNPTSLMRKVETKSNPPQWRRAPLDEIRRTLGSSVSNLGRFCRTLRRLRFDTTPPHRPPADRLFNRPEQHYVHQLPLVEA